LLTINKKRGVMMAKEKINLYLLAMLAIVAVVGIVVLVLGAETSSLSLSSDDLSGQAFIRALPSGTQKTVISSEPVEEIVDVSTSQVDTSHGMSCNPGEHCCPSSDRCYSCTTEACPH
jgi:hypothetical protein